MIKTWAFYRRSTDLQEFSIEDQRKACQQFATDKGWSIVKEFTPQKGFASGLTIDRDPQFLEMIHAAEGTNHGASYLVVYDVSRFGRLNPEEKIYWEQRFKKEGKLQVIYVKDDFKNDNSMADGILKFLKHGEAREYSVKLSASTLRGCKTHAGLGHSCGGSAPYGYDRLLIDQTGQSVQLLERGRHKADKLQRVVWAKGKPEAVNAVIYIFEEFLRGIGLNKISDGLNKKHIPSPSKGVWAKSAVRSLLTNPAYTGVRFYNKRNWQKRNEKGGYTKNPRSEWIIKEDAHPALISKEIFGKAQSMFKTRKPGAGRQYSNTYLFSGLITCKHCGQRFQGHAKHHGDYKKFYYTCGGYVAKGTHVCSCFSVPAEQAENFAMDEINARLNSPSVMNEIKAQLRVLLQRQEIPGCGKAASLGNSLKTITRQMSYLVDAIKQGKSYPALLEELDKLEEQKKSLQAEQAAEMAKPALAINPEAILGRFKDGIADYKRIMAHGSNEEKKLAIRAHIARIEADPKERKLIFHFYRIPLNPNENAAWGLPDGASSRDSSVKVVAGAGFEPATSRLWALRATRLLYPAELV